MAAAEWKPTMRPGSNPLWPTAVIVGLMAVFFVLDLALPTGVASGVPYILPVLIALRLPGRFAPIIVAGVATALTAVGFFLPMPNPSEEPIWIGLDNRFIAVLAIWSTAVLGYLFSVRDADVHDRELRLRAVVDTTPDLIVTIDGGGRIESCNASAVGTFDQPRDDLIGKRLTDLIGPVEPQSDGSLAPDASELIAEGRAGNGLCSIGSGAVRTVRWIVRPLDDSGRRLAVGHDLTEVLAAQTRAVQSERLAAIGQTLATLSHESKNELLAIRFGLEQLGRCWDDQEAVSDLISELLNSQDRVWRLFEDVRSFAAPIHLRPASASLPEVWRLAWDKASKGQRRGELHLIESVSEGAAECIADPFRLEQVFRNLFENAIAACPESVRVEVNCAEGAWRGEPAVTVAVRDNGPGLSDDARARLFEPFFTTKPRGTGLGLSLSRRILEAHHGDLLLGPAGGGAEFVLVLPRSALTLSADAALA
ncbi:MAG: ATP-binding protein [Planctomycetaceae bacterium]